MHNHGHIIAVTAEWHTNDVSCGLRSAPDAPSASCLMQQQPQGGQGAAAVLQTLDIAGPGCPDFGTARARLPASYWTATGVLYHRPVCARLPSGQEGRGWLLQGTHPTERCMHSERANGCVSRHSASISNIHQALIGSCSCTGSWGSESKPCAPLPSLLAAARPGSEWRIYCTSALCGTQQDCLEQRPVLDARVVLPPAGLALSQLQAEWEAAKRQGAEGGGSAGRLALQPITSPVLNASSVQVGTVGTTQGRSLCCLRM